MIAHRPLLHPRDEIMQTMERIYRYRMTTTSGGNLSIREENGDLWITPASVDKGSLTRNDIVCVKHGGAIEGPHRPSSELPFHQAIYEARPEVRGIVHAHPVALVAFSIVRQVPNTRLFHQARHVCGEVGFAPYALPGSRALGENIAATFRQGFHCVVLENHGVVVVGESLQEAFQRFETLEFTAKTIVKARLLGEVRYLNDEQVQLPRRMAEPLPEFDPPPPTSREKELRRQLREFVQRGYRQRLLISTEGSFSARLNEDAFLITPYRVDRSKLELDDLVLVSHGAAERGKLASRASRNHREIYRRHSSVGAIVNAYTVNATAFCVTAAALDSRTIPESYLFLRDVGRLAYGLQFQDSCALADCISPHNPIVLLENDGVLVTGANVLDAFDRLEVLESTAEAVINARALGEVTPMSATAIDELRNAFLTAASVGDEHALPPSAQDAISPFRAALEQTIAELEAAGDTAATELAQRLRHLGAGKEPTLDVEGQRQLLTCLVSVDDKASQPGRSPPWLRPAQARLRELLAFCGSYVILDRQLVGRPLASCAKLAEAVGYVEAQHPPQHVARVIQPGYAKTLPDGSQEVLRRAKVVLAR